MSLAILDGGGQDRFGTVSPRFPHSRVVDDGAEQRGEEIRAFRRARVPLVSGTCETVRLEWTIHPHEWTLREDIRRDEKSGAVVRTFVRSRHPSMASLPPLSSASDTVPLGEIDVEGGDGIDASSSRRNRQTYRIYVTER